VVSLKSKLLSALAVVLIVSIVLSTYAAFAAAAPKASNEKPAESQKIYNSFTLAASGTAINAADEVVGVSFLIQGNANGKLKTVFHLHTQNGDTIIEGYDAISAVRGQGIVVNKNYFIHLSIMMSSDNYGGRNTLWVLRGTTDALTDDTLPVSLQAPRVVLPIEGYPQLTGLSLDGTITFQ
jgi:hypothetical protein